MNEKAPSYMCPILFFVIICTFPALSVLLKIICNLTPSFPCFAHFVMYWTEQLISILLFTFSHYVIFWRCVFFCEGIRLGQRHSRFPISRILVTIFEGIPQNGNRYLGSTYQCNKWCLHPTHLSMHNDIEQQVFGQKYSQITCFRKRNAEITLLKNRWPRKDGRCRVG